ncbi:hypothetical protein JCM11957_15640 [Caminibacter profundus]
MVVLDTFIKEVKLLLRIIKFTTIKISLCIVYNPLKVLKKKILFFLNNTNSKMFRHFSIIKFIPIDNGKWTMENDEKY